MTTTNARDAKVNSLVLKLQKCFADHKDEDKDINTMAMILFYRRTLVAEGHELKEISAGGWMGEFTLAFDENGTTSTKRKGVDITTANGPIESKETVMPLGQRANVCFHPPVKKRGETIDEYYARLKEDMMKKGRILVVHRFDNTQVKYEFDPEFIHFYMRYRNYHTMKNLNIGSTSCTTCKRIHRLDDLLKAQAAWQEKPNEFDTKVFEKKVVSQCE